MNYVKKLVFVILCTLLLAACSEKDNSNASNTGDKSTTESGTASSKNELVIAVNENFISMDPHNTGDTNSSSVQETMLEGLLGFDADGQIIKVLADDYSISEDALVYTFKLKEGVTFHDGEQFNAEL
nr:ABC transporter substrate-binding protein [Lysinibacillus boronitolerans]